MITIEKLLENKDFIIRTARELGFEVPCLYRAIHAEPKTYFYLALESVPSVMTQQKFKLNEHQRVRYLELLLERELKEKELECTVIARTKSTLALNLQGYFEEIEKEFKLLSDDDNKIIKYYGKNFTFIKEENTGLSPDEKLLDKDTLDDIEELKEKIRFIQTQGSLQQENIAPLVTRFSSPITSGIRNLPDQLEEAKQILSKVKETIERSSPKTKKQCTTDIAVIETLVHEIKVLSLEPDNSNAAQQ